MPKTMNLGTYDGVNVNMTIADETIIAGTNTVPGSLSLKNENSHPVVELESQIDSKLNVAPSNFGFKKINPGDTKTIHFIINVPESTAPSTYDIKVKFDFKIDTPAAVTNGLLVTVIKDAA